MVIKYWGFRNPKKEMSYKKHIWIHHKVLVGDLPVSFIYYWSLEGNTPMLCNGCVWVEGGSRQAQKSDPCTSSMQRLLRTSMSLLHRRFTFSAPKSNMRTSKCMAGFLKLSEDSPYIFAFFNHIKASDWEIKGGVMAQPLKSLLGIPPFLSSCWFESLLFWFQSSPSTIVLQGYEPLLWKTLEEFWVHDFSLSLA